MTVEDGEEEEGEDEDDNADSNEKCLDFALISNFLPLIELATKYSNLYQYSQICPFFISCCAS